MLLAVSLAAPAFAAFYDFEQITVDATAGGKSLTAAKVTAFTQTVTCRARTAEISFLYLDPLKTTVTSSVGQLLEPGDTITLTDRQDMLNFRAIRTGATSGQLDCAYKYTQAP